MPLFQFIGATLGASTVVILASLLWPKVTSQPRPDALEKVRDVVVETEAGKRLADTLGVTNDAAVEPLSLPSLAASAAQTVMTTIVTQTQHAVTTKVLESVIKQFDQLPPNEKDRFREMICTPQVE